MSNARTILSVQSSGREAGSISRQLSSEFLAALQQGGLTLGAERDLTQGMPFVDAPWIAANFTAPQTRTAEQSAALAYSDMLVEELEAADVVVIGAPIYNFGPPAVLKAWIDQVARVHRTFRYTPSGPVGLLTGKTAVLVMASGGTAVDSPIDFATPYLRHALGFVGIEDVHVIAADAQMAGAPEALARARDELAQIAATLAGSPKLAAA